MDLTRTRHNIFKNIVLKAKKYIKKGDIVQVVLSQRFETKLNKPPFEIYKKLRIKNPSSSISSFNSFFSHTAWMADPNAVNSFPLNPLSLSIRVSL